MAYRGPRRGEKNEMERPEMSVLAVLIGRTNYALNE